MNEPKSSDKTQKFLISTMSAPILTVRRYQLLNGARSSKKHCLLVQGSKALRQRETTFIDTVGDTINLGSENVVHDDRDRGSTDTKRRVIKGLGDTLRKPLSSLATTGFTKRGERSDHPDNRSKQTHQGSYRSNR